MSRRDFVIIVKPEFFSNEREEKYKEEICYKLAKIIARIRGVYSAEVDWKGEKDE